MTPVEVSVTDGRKRYQIAIPIAVIAGLITIIIGYADLKADVRTLKESQTKAGELATKQDVEAVQKRVDEIYRLLAQRPASDR